MKYGIKTTARYKSPYIANITWPKSKGKTTTRLDGLHRGRKQHKKSIKTLWNSRINDKILEKEV